MHLKIDELTENLRNIEVTGTPEELERILDLFGLIPNAPHEMEAPQAWGPDRLDIQDGASAAFGHMPFTNTEEEPVWPTFNHSIEEHVEAVRKAIQEVIAAANIPALRNTDEEIWEQVDFEDIQVGDYIRHMWDQYGVLHTREGFVDQIKHNGSIALGEKYVVIASKARSHSIYYRLIKHRTPKEF